jgi:zinc/manganese transport system ATP-binding protein
MASIRFTNLSFSYARHPRHKPVLDAIDVDIPLGSLLAIVGPNGAGKSTLLKILAGILKPASGYIHLGGVASELVAYLPQHTEIDRHFPISIYQLVAMGLWRFMRGSGGLTPALRKKVDAALDHVGLDGFGDRAISSLSGGQLQRVLFARLLLQDASIILLDEPFNAIDSKTTADLMHLLTQWRDQGRTVIVVLHDLDQVKEQFPHTLMIAHRVIASGATNFVLTSDNLQNARQACADYHESTLNKIHKAHAS